MLEKSWNTSVRVMFDLPMKTHRYFIESVSRTLHLKYVLIERFLSFLSQISKSNKTIPKHILSSIMNDTRSITGSNIRNILLLTNKYDIYDVTKHDIRNLKYNEPSKEDMWKVDFIQEISLIKSGSLNVTDFTDDELNDIMEHICTS